MRTRFVAAFLIASIAAAAAGCASTNDPDHQEESALELGPPKQFIAMGFDGSLNVAFWDESLNFAKQQTEAGKPLRFTYFISGVYFVPNALKSSRYKAPHGLGWGKSAIGFGGDEPTIRIRVDRVDRAADEKHEIASHANGHFDGSQWTYEDWKSEFAQFDQIFFGDRAVKRLSRTTANQVVGFRAPQLGHSPGLFQVLADRAPQAENDYMYDTSKTSAPNYWPQKSSSGVWNFPLAQLRIVGSGKKTLSMDYNFYVADSRGLNDAANMGRYRKQMYDTYMAYFKNNYYGNRAPLHIGHHFSKWNGGAYWEAMKDFAKEVCGKPDVVCGTYKELVAYLEAMSPEERAAYRNGQFRQVPRPTGPDSENDVAEDFFEQAGEGDFVMDSEDAHEKDETPDHDEQPSLP